MDELIQGSISGAIVILGLVLAYALTKLASYWSTQREQILQKMEANDSDCQMVIKNYLIERVIAVVDDVVAALNGTMKKEILNASQDGKLTKEDGKKIRDKALSLIKQELPKSVYGEITTIYGDIDEALKTLIEVSVEKQKVKENKE